MPPLENHFQIIVEFYLTLKFELFKNKKNVEKVHFIGCIQRAILTPGSGSYTYSEYGITYPDPNSATQMNTDPFLPDPDPQPAGTELFRNTVSLAN
jgi:hypothetical protein